MKANKIRHIFTQNSKSREHPNPDHYPTVPLYAIIFFIEILEKRQNVHHNRRILRASSILFKFYCFN
ncbi:unnamed protein product [Caenorhabditis nigoni]